MRQAHQCPFASHFVYSPQQKLPEPTRLLDLSEHRFHDRTCAPRKPPCPLWFSASSSSGPPASRPSAADPLGHGFSILVVLLPPVAMIPFDACAPVARPIPELPDSFPSNNRCPPKSLPVVARSAARSLPPSAATALCRWPPASPSAPRSTATSGSTAACAL